MPSLVAAYGLMWLLLLGFVWLVARRQARTEARLRELEQALLKPPPSP
jgi:CcmD family protein